MPLIESLPGGFGVGSRLVIMGSTFSNADRFSINLQCGRDVWPHKDDVVLHVTVDFFTRICVRNTILNTNWGVSESDGEMSLLPGQTFTIAIISDPIQFTIQINESNQYRFRHRLPIQRISHITLDGCAVVKEIRFNTHNSIFTGAGSYLCALLYPEFGCRPFLETTPPSSAEANATVQLEPGTNNKPKRSSMPKLLRMLKMLRVPKMSQKRVMPRVLRVLRMFRIPKMFPGSCTSKLPPMPRMPKIFNKPVVLSMPKLSSFPESTGLNPFSVQFVRG